MPAGFSDIVFRGGGLALRNQQAKEATMPTVDLNSDLAKFLDLSLRDDDAMLSIVTSANVACGLHAGDPEVMARTFAVARERGVAVGAHPGFPICGGLAAAVFRSRTGRSNGLSPIRSAPPPRSRLTRAIALPM